MTISRKLQAVHQDLNVLAGQGMVEGFFSNADNADTLRGLVDDIRDAIVAYQVCTYRFPTSGAFDVCTRPRCSKIYTTRIVNSLWVSPHFTPSL